MSANEITTLPQALHVLVADPALRGRLSKAVQSRVRKAYEKEASAKTCREAVFAANEAWKDFHKTAKRIEIQRAVDGPPDEWSEYLFEQDIEGLVSRKVAFEAAAEACRRDLAAEVDYETVYDQLAATWTKHVDFEWNDEWSVAELRKREAEAARLRPLILRVNQIVADAAFGDIPDGGTLALRKTTELIDARTLFIHAEASEAETDATDEVGE